jgi:hypothetical protein
MSKGAMAMTEKPTVVRVPNDVIAKCEAYATAVAAHYDGSDLHAMPWSRYEMNMTPEQLREWVASRKEAGQLIDIETCEIGCWFADANGDHYGIIREMLGDHPHLEDGYTDKFNFVRSSESGGWICEGDLPRDKGRALYDRIQRERTDRTVT